MFDPNDAVLSDRDLFPPFSVKVTRPLGDAIRIHRVHPDAPVLLTTSGDHALALLTSQMSIHHVAQGELVGNPWMVSF